VLLLIEVKPDNLFDVLYVLLGNEGRSLLVFNNCVPVGSTAAMKVVYIIKMARLLSKSLSCEEPI
jgi:hypothetical protein